MSNPIFEALNAQFSKHRTLFWYDDDGTQRQSFDDYDNPDVEKTVIENNEFAVKHNILNADISARFLVYSPSPKPADRDNWLLDLNLQHMVFATNQAAMVIQELGIDPALEPVVDRHIDFFSNKSERLEPLKVVLPSSSVDENDLCMAMIGIITSDTRAEREHGKSLTDVCIRLFRDAASEEPRDYWNKFIKFRLNSFFWGSIEKQFQYSSSNPSIESLLAFLFTKAFEYEVKHVVEPANRQAYTFIDRWRNSFDEVASYTKLSDKFEKELNIAQHIGDSRLDEMLDWDLFKAFDRHIVHKMVEAINNDSLSPRSGLERIKRRKATYWTKTDESGRLKNVYDCIETYLLFTTSLSGIDSLPSTLQKLWTCYTTDLYIADYYYRKFLHHCSNVHQSILTPLLDRIEKTYTNGYLSKLTHKWQDKLSTGAIKDRSIAEQSRFFRQYVLPYINQGKTILVVCSDALRYEAAKELAQRLAEENRIQVETDAMIASIPSYTQLGMASLLPHKDLAVDPETSVVTVDGINSAGQEGRGKVLESYFADSNSDVKSKTMDARWFMDLPIQQQEEEIEGCQCVYLYSGHIDSTGDNAKTEASLPTAVEAEISFLTLLAKKILNLNRTHILITADHGFLFQHKPLEDSDQIQLDQSSGECKRDRRFVLGRDLPEDDRLMNFSSEDLNLQGDFQVQIPKGLARIRKQGGGSRYVHGGMTIHELCVPVLKIRKTRSDDVREVDFSLMSKSETITTNQIAVTLFQEEPVSAKVQGRRITLRFEGADGHILSDQCDIVFDSADVNAQNRDQKVSFVFSKEIDKYNNQTINLCFYQERHDQLVPIRDPSPYRLQISILPDF